MRLVIILPLAMIWAIPVGCGSADPDATSESATPLASNPSTSVLLPNTSTTRPPSQDVNPYEDEYSNLTYHLLFADRPDIYKENYAGPFEPPFSTLFGDVLDHGALQSLARDETMESRIRAIAFNLLRSVKASVPENVLLGTIIEFRLPPGLDVLAVYSDGSARYINWTGKTVIVEGTPNPFQKEIASVLSASNRVVAATDPWEKGRLPPPRETWQVRTTLLVSDGLRLREGSADEMESDATTGPLCKSATLLLLKITQEATKDD